MNNLEIRNRAWNQLWNGKWFWKLFGAYFLLQIAAQMVVSLANFIPSTCGVYNVGEFVEGFEAGEGLPEFSSGMALGFISSLALYVFFCLIASGIYKFGICVLINRAADGNDGAGWVKAAFRGVKIPLSLAWLMFRLVLVFLGWFVLFVLPTVLLLAIFEYLELLSANPLSVAIVSTGLAVFYIAVLSVPFYRYRYLFRIKSDYPGWSAGECMRHCRFLTTGEKWRIFKHDCSYWRVFLIPLFLMAGLIGLIAACIGVEASQGEVAADAVLIVVSIVSFVLIYPAIVVSSMIFFFYNAVGQSVLYREISSEKHRETSSGKMDYES